MHFRITTPHPLSSPKQFTRLTHFLSLVSSYYYLHRCRSDDGSKHVQISINRPTSPAKKKYGMPRFVFDNCYKQSSCIRNISHRCFLAHWKYLKTDLSTDLLTNSLSKYPTEWETSKLKRQEAHKQKNFPNARSSFFLCELIVIVLLMVIIQSKKIVSCAYVTSNSHKPESSNPYAQCYYSQYRPFTSAFRFKY